MADTSSLEEQKVFERLCSDKSELWWVTVGVDSSVQGSNPKAQVSASGDTGVEGLKDYLYPDQILYGAIKVLGVDTKGAVTSTRQKTIFFQWVGPQVPKIKVAKAISLKKALGSYFQGHHVALEVYEKGNLTEADLEARLRSCGGAHQPDRFVFGTGTTVNVAVPYTPLEISAPAPAPVSAPTPAPAPAPVAFPKAVTVTTNTVSSSSSSSNEKKEVENDDDYITKPKGRAVNMFTTSNSSSNNNSTNSTTPSSVTSTSTHSSSHSSKPSSTSGTPNVDVLAAVQALGRAASRLQQLIDSSTNGTVSTNDLQKFVAAELGEAAVRSAAALATHTA